METVVEENETINKLKGLTSSPNSPHPNSIKNTGTTLVHRGLALKHTGLRGSAATK